MIKWTDYIKKGKAQLLVGVLTTVLGSLYLAVSLNFNNYDLFPVANMDQYTIGTWREDVDTNSSQANYQLNNNEIKFSYSLTSELAEPFAAFYLRHKDTTGFVNLREFNSLSIYLKSEKAQRIPVMLRLHNDDAKLGKMFSEILLSTTIDYEGEGEYKIALEDFQLPAWWLRQFGIEHEDIDRDKVTQLKYIAIGSCQALQPGDSDVITIKEVSFGNDYSTVYFMTGLSLMLLYLVLFVHFKFKSSNKTVTVMPVEVDSVIKGSEKQLELIKNFIGENFQNSELNYNDLHKGTSISASQIRLVLKEYEKDSFKNYLKTVRMTEVKRVLIESNLSISESAYMCGFGDIPHFNRLFKNDMGVTPKEFRSSFKE